MCDTDIKYQPSDGSERMSLEVMCDTDIPYQPSDGSERMSLEVMTSA
jgi:hypothetical protein